MTDHPITPPPELVQQWADMLASRSDEAVFSLAAQWGYEQRGEINEAKLQQARDQELEACIDFVRRGPWCSEKLRAARRPKPPTLAEKALEQYDRCVSILEEKGYSPAGCIRAALERLKQLEDSNE
jgi:hypothetical protein